MTIRTVGKGQRVQQQMTADTWNAFVRAANANDINSRETNQNAGSGIEYPFSTVKTLTTAAVDFRDVVGLTTPDILPSQGQQSFNTRSLWTQQTPTRGRFGLVQSAGPPGTYRTTISGGIVQCKLQVDTNGEWIDRADVDTTDATRLRAVPNGSAQILWKETGTGEVDAIVRLGNPQHVNLTGTAVDDIPGGSTGNVNVWLNGSTQTNYIIGTGVGNTLNEPVYLDWMHQGLQVSAGKQVIIGWFPHESRWRITHAECEDNPPTIGQLVDDGLGGTQTVTTTPATINAFNAAADGTIATPNVILNAANASIQLPDITSTEIYRYAVSGILVPGSNNVEYEILLFANGVETSPPVAVLDGRQAGTSLTYSFTGLTVLEPASSPVFDLRIAMVAGTDTINWSACTFMLEKNLDF